MDIKQISYIILICLGVCSFIGLMVYLIVRLFSGDNNDPNENTGGSICSPDCGPNGKCNIYTSTCDCNDGYKGKLCDSVCPGANRDCNKNGECTDDAQCKCYDGFGGPDCSIKCTNCNPNGSCDKDGSCDCVDGFGGYYCSVKCPNCNSPNGSCNKNGTCDCVNGFTGDDCSIGVTNISISNYSLSTQPIPFSLTPSFDSRINQYTAYGTQSTFIWKIDITSKNNITVSACDSCDPTIWGLVNVQGQGTTNISITVSFKSPDNFQLPIKISSATASKTYFINIKLTQ